MSRGGGGTSSQGYRPSNLRVREAKEDVDLLKMALDQMWPVEGSKKRDIVDRQLDIIRDPLIPAVVRTLAAKNIISMGVCNLKAIELMVKAGLASSTPEEARASVTSDEELVAGTQRLLEDRSVESTPMPKLRESESSEWEVAG